MFLTKSFEVLSVKCFFTETMIPTIKFSAEMWETMQCPKLLRVKDLSDVPLPAEALSSSRKQ